MATDDSISVRDDDNGSSEDEKKRTRRKKSSKKKSSSKHKRKRRHHDSDESSVSSASSSSMSSRDRERRKKKRRRKEESRREALPDEGRPKGKKSSSKKHERHRKDRRKDKKKKKRKRKRDHSDSESSSSSSSRQIKEDDRNVLLMDALCELFEQHPALAEDLPIMLIRMVQDKAQFDLTQMTDTSAAQLLHQVFVQLQQFGVQNSNGGWLWEGPGGGSTTTTDSRILCKVIRAMMNEIGFTHDAVELYEGGEALRTKKLLEEQSAVEQVKIRATQILRQNVEALLASFGQRSTANAADDKKKADSSSDLSRELSGLCDMIVNGETVAIDGIPDEHLRGSLERVLLQCGLEKVEMEDDDGSDDSNDDGPAMGLGLPEINAADALTKLNTVMGVCRTFSKIDGKARRPMKGPMRNPADYAEYEKAAADDDSSDDEGPSQHGTASSRHGPSMSSIKAAADARAREMMKAKGIALPAPPNNDGTVREEWILEPGKFDFLSAVKASTSTRSRQFQTKSVGEAAARPVAPAIKSEIDAIMEAHREVRGPSLVDQHQQAKAERAAEKSANDDSWQWSRDKDLDSGRRVDKNALNMVFGGASDGLKSKFQNSFGG